MMEFTLSRVAMCVCGVMLMMVVAGPVTDVLEDREDSMEASAGGSLTEVIDGFADSDAQTAIIDLALYIPAGSSVSVHGDMMVLETESGPRAYLLRTGVQGGGTFGCGDVLKLEKTDGGVRITPLD